jgi:hypothetical protein
MASKATVQKFGPQDKSRITGKVGHSRTGACTAKGRCFHGDIKRRG